MPVRNLSRKDLDFAASLTVEEGWNYTPAEIGLMLDLDPDGSFVYEDDGPRGIATCVTYGRTGVLGHLIVSKAGRGKRIGHSLLIAAIGYMETKGCESLLVYATEAAVGLYQKHGFNISRYTECMHLKLDGAYRRERSPRCMPIEPSDLSEIEEIDRRLFGDSRGKLLDRLYREHPKAAFKLERSGRIEGFIMGRPDHVGSNLGPWACLTGKEEDAEALFRTAMSVLSDGKIYVGSFSNNHSALRIANQLPTIRSWRIPLMVRGKNRYEDGPGGVFGIAAYELG